MICDWEPNKSAKPLSRQDVEETIKELRETGKLLPETVLAVSPQMARKFGWIDVD